MSLNKTENMSVIPYGRHRIDDDDIAAVVDTLRSDWLTTGPKVGEFEAAVARFCRVAYGVAVSSGTAALHVAMHAIGLEPGDEVIVPAMTFVATANSVVYQGGKPVFADVHSETLLVDPVSVEALITPSTKAIVAVDYGGQPCDYDRLRDIADRHKLILIADACHSLGGTFHGQPVGSLADLTIFSFHPVKHITTGEGGMIVTNNEEWDSKMRRFRNHGISSDHFKRQQEGTWSYEMVELGFNYRISDIQCALGLSQLKKLPAWLARRRDIAAAYDSQLKDVAAVKPLLLKTGIGHAYHLYVVCLAEGISREKVFQYMRQSGVGVNVHYIPVHLHPFYQEKFKTRRGLCPVAEKMYEHLLTLPLHQSMGGVNDVQRGIRSLQEALKCM